MSDELKALFSDRDMFLIRESFRAGTFFSPGQCVTKWLNEQVADNGGTVEQLLAYEASPPISTSEVNRIKAEALCEALVRLDTHGPASEEQEIILKMIDRLEGE